MSGFAAPSLAALAGVAFAWGLSGPAAALTVALLAAMEVSLSFDNAVVNASALRRMAPRWQKAFLTWGMLVAVFGMRLLFPVLIVSAATGLGFTEVARLALNRPDEYGRHLAAAHAGIASFGGMFLLIVFLGFACDEAKDVHWVGAVERRLSSLGRMDAVEVAIALGALLAVQTVVPDASRLTSLTAGVAGVVCYVTLKGLTGLFADGDNLSARAGFPAFVYLEVLDASFSLDGVIGAFAMSTDIAVIMTGLGIGALFVRTLTVQFVRRGTLDAFIYLEHGAHWGIGALAVIMLASLRVEVAETVTGLVGVSLIGLSLLSSVMHRRKQRG